MKDDKFVKKLVFSVITFQIFLTAIAFIVQILRIYFGNKDSFPIFTRDMTIASIMEIFAIIIIFIIFVISVGILSFIYKLDDDKNVKNEALATLNILIKKIPEERKNSEEYNELIKLNKKRKYAYLIATCITLVCILFAFLYMFNPKHFISEGNALTQCNNLFLYLSPWIIIAFLAFIGAKLYENHNAKEAINIAKKIIDPKKSTYGENKSQKKLRIAQGVILSVALIMVIVGVFTGGAFDVFAKAAKICSECIGLG